MARIAAGVATSHIPALGATIDHAETQDAYWEDCFAGYDWTRSRVSAEKPDVVVLVYNDYATAFDMNVISTFAIGCADDYGIAAEGWGLRPVPEIKGHADLA